VLQPGGRLVVISFHSLEDRIVKQFIAKHSPRGGGPPRRRLPCLLHCKLRALGRVMPSRAEVKANARSRSAVMRVAERTDVPA
jgi:16S rRNA (cytosine1402-N4)-methyltransferase